MATLEWIPQSDACPICQAMKGIYHQQSIARPHPNCRCTIVKRDEEDEGEAQDYEPGNCTNPSITVLSRMVTSSSSEQGDRSGSWFDSSGFESQWFEIETEVLCRDGQTLVISTTVEYSGDELHAIRSLDIDSFAFFVLEDAAEQALQEAESQCTPCQGQGGDRKADESKSVA